MATHTPSKGWGPPALGPKPLTLYEYKFNTLFKNAAGCGFDVRSSGAKAVQTFKLTFGGHFQ